MGNMPLLSEFASYPSWGAAAKRWNNLMYNHPVSSVIEYYINNLKNSTNILDKGTGGFLKSQFRKKQDQNEKSLSSGESFGKIGYEWMFRILKDMYKEAMGSHKKVNDATRGHEPGDLPGSRTRCPRSRRSVGLVIKETRRFTKFRKKFSQ